VSKEIIHQHHDDGDTVTMERLSIIRDWRDQQNREIERRLEAPAFAERRWYRLSEVMAQCVPNNDPNELARYRTAFEHSLQCGTFSVGKNKQSRIFFANSSPQLGLKITWLTYEMFRDAKRLYEEADQSSMSVRITDWWRPNAHICWIPRAHLINWLQRHSFPIPQWLGGQVAPKRRNAGRKHLYDWEEVNLFVEKVLNEKGDFDDPKNAEDGWRGQADLERLVAKHIENTEKKDAPVHSTIWTHIAPVIAAWRQRQAVVC
jgi:hypothetical protein